MPNLYRPNPRIVPQSQREEYRRRLDKFGREHQGCTANEFTRAKMRIAEDVGIRL